MANVDTSTSQEVIEKLEEIEKETDQEVINKLLEDLEQHEMFTNPDPRTIEIQFAVRQKIAELSKDIFLDIEVTNRLKKLQDKLIAPPPPEEAEKKPPEELFVRDELMAPPPPEEVEEEVEEEIEEKEEGEEEGPELVSREEIVEKTPDTITSLFKSILRNPDDFDADLIKIKDPAILAIVDLLKKENLWPERKKFDKQRFEELKAILRTSEKAPRASLRAVIKKWQKEGVETEDQLDQKISEFTAKAKNLKAQTEDLKQEIDQYGIIKGETGLSDKQQKAFEKASDDYKAKKQELRKAQNTLEELKAIEPYYGEIKMDSRQILLKTLQFIRGEKESLQRIESEAEKLISRQEKGLMQVSKLDYVSRLFKPSLKATLKEFVKIDELEGMKPEDFETLLRLRNNPEGLLSWMKKLKEKAHEVVPVIIAYLQMTVAEGRLNVLSRGQAMDLLKNLRLTRNKLIIQKVNRNPELANAKPQIKMQAFLKELNGWDEKCIEVNRDIVKDLVRKSSLKKVSKLAVGGVALTYAWPLLSLPVITSALSYIGWGKVGLIGGHIIGKKLVKTYQPEHEKVYKHVVTRLVGLGVLGPIGLAAPELFKGLKFSFKKRKEIKAGVTKTAKTGGKIVRGGAKVTKKAVVGGAIAATALAAGTWAVAKGTTKALTFPLKAAAYPFKALKKRKLAA